MNKLNDFYRAHKKIINIIVIVLMLILFVLPIATRYRVNRNGEYFEKEDVARYIIKYHELPRNYITKDCRRYIIDNNISLNDEYKRKMIGGDTHFNDGALSSFGIDDEMLKECDYYTEGFQYNAFTQGGRGEYRLVYTTNVKNVKVFDTNNHYHNFVELTHVHLQLASNICWIIFAIYDVIIAAFYGCIIYSSRKMIDKNPSDNN